MQGRPLPYILSYITEQRRYVLLSSRSWYPLGVLPILWVFPLDTKRVQRQRKSRAVLIQRCSRRATKAGLWQ